MGETAWSGNVTFRGNDYYNFKAKTKLGMRQAIFKLNEYMSDYVPPQYHWESKFYNV